MNRFGTGSCQEVRARRYSFSSRVSSASTGNALVVEVP